MATTPTVLYPRFPLLSFADLIVEKSRFSLLPVQAVQYV